MLLKTIHSASGCSNTGRQDFPSNISTLLSTSVLLTATTLSLTNYLPLGSAANGGNYQQRIQCVTQFRAANRKEFVKWSDIFRKVAAASANVQNSGTVLSQALDTESVTLAGEMYNIIHQYWRKVHNECVLQGALGEYTQLNSGFYIINNGIDRVTSNIFILHISQMLCKKINTLK